MSELKKDRLFVVLGMHRSGTSAITRSLSVLGVELGDRLLPPVEGDNAKGFWEDIDLHILDIEMLKFLGTDWSHLAMITPRDVDSLRQQGFFLRAVELIRRKVASSLHFGFKDPRVAKLLPFWRAVFAHCNFEVSYVFAMRNPLSVARSLGKRDGIETEQSYLLWLGHVVVGLVNSVGSPCVIIDYDRLMQSPESELARLAERLDLKIDADALQSYKEDFLDENLRHTVYVADDLLVDQTCPQMVHEVYATLLEVACDRLHLQDSGLQEKIGNWFNQYQDLQHSLRLADKLLKQKAVARAHALEHEGQLCALQKASDEAIAANQQESSARDARIASLEEHTKLCEQQVAALEQVVVERNEQLRFGNAALTERDTQLNELRVAMDERDVQLNELRLGLAERDAQLNELRLVLTERDTQLINLRTELAERDVQLNALSPLLAERDLQLSELSRVLAEFKTLHASETERLQQAVFESEFRVAGLNRTVQALRSSTSWRVSAPVRWLGSAARALTGGAFWH